MSNLSFHQFLCHLVLVNINFDFFFFKFDRFPCLSSFDQKKTIEKVLITFLLQPFLNLSNLI